MRPFLLVAILAIALGAGSSARSQHTHAHGAHKPAEATAGDARVFVTFPEKLVDHTLANMRDHLMALQEIQEHLGMGNTDGAARIAETRLGMSSLASHGAHEVARFMPQGMQDAGSAMHRSASQFAVVAVNSGVTGDMKPVFAALGHLTATCVGCHAAYRIK